MWERQRSDRLQLPGCHEEGMCQDWKPPMDIVTHPGEIMKGSLEEVMKV